MMDIDLEISTKLLMLSLKRKQIIGIFYQASWRRSSGKISTDCWRTIERNFLYSTCIRRLETTLSLIKFDICCGRRYRILKIVLQSKWLQNGDKLFSASHLKKNFKRKMASAIQIVIVYQGKCGIVSLRHQLLPNLLARKVYWSLKVLVVVDLEPSFLPFLLVMLVSTSNIFNLFNFYNPPSWVREVAVFARKPYNSV